MNLRDSIIITPITDGSADRYGNPADSAGTPVTVRAWVTPAGMQELEAGQRDTRLSQYSVIVEATVSVNARSQVSWNSRTFEVIGEPKLFSYRNGDHHYEFLMEERVG